jgi:hypothetical protein
VPLDQCQSTTASIGLSVLGQTVGPRTKQEPNNRAHMALHALQGTQLQWKLPAPCAVDYHARQRFSWGKRTERTWPCMRCQLPAESMRRWWRLPLPCGSEDLYCSCILCSQLVTRPGSLTKPRLVESLRSLQNQPATGQRPTKRTIHRLQPETMARDPLQEKATHHNCLVRSWQHLTNTQQ